MKNNWIIVFITDTLGLACLWLTPLLFMKNKPRPAVKDCTGFDLHIGDKVLYINDEYNITDIINDFIFVTNGEKILSGPSIFFTKINPTP